MYDVGVPPLQRAVQEVDRAAGMIVGVDLDGVLGDQVTGVLPRIKQRLGIDLTYDDITEFRLPLGSTDLAAEIEVAQQDESYLRDMEPYEGTVRFVTELRQRYRVLLITARPPAARLATERWLRANKFEFDGVVNAEECKKSIYGTDALIDDYTGNVADFVQHTTGLGLLLDRPWNRQDRDVLAGWIRQGRVVVVPDLTATFRHLEAFDLHRRGRHVIRH